MKKFFGKKRTLALAVVAVLAVAAAAFAYWSQTGSGSGSGSVGAGTNDLVITGDASQALVPGGSSPVSGNVHNSNSQTSEQVGTISGAVVVDANHAANCSASDFHVNVTQPSTTVVAPSGDQAFSATVTMDNTSANQDGCKGAGLTINWSSN